MEVRKLICYFHGIFHNFCFACCWSFLIDFFAFLWFSAPTQPTDMQKCFKKINRNARKEIEKLLLLPVHQKDYDGTGSVFGVFLCVGFFSIIFLTLFTFCIFIVASSWTCSLARFCSAFVPFLIN